MMRPDRLDRRNELFNRACTDPVLVEHYLGLTGNQERSYTTPPATYYASIIERQQLIRALDGQQIVATTHITFAIPSPHLGADDRITLPDGTQPVILGIEQGPAGGAMFPTIVHT